MLWIPQWQRRRTAGHASQAPFLLDAGGVLKVPGLIKRGLVLKGLGFKGLFYRFLSRRGCWECTSLEGDSNKAGYLSYSHLGTCTLNNFLDLLVLKGEWGSGHWLHYGGIYGDYTGRL